MDFFTSEAQELIARQGWSDETMLTLVDKFLSERELHPAFDLFLKNQAQEENSQVGGDRA